MPEHIHDLPSASAWCLPAAEIDRLIFEDAPAGDLTTEALGIGDTPAQLTLSARDPMIVAGVEVAQAMMQRAGLTVTRHTRSGERLAPGTLALTAQGDAAGVHLVWKCAKNLMEYLSGIASATRAMVDAAAQIDSTVRISLTRKTFPGSRRLSQLAVQAGGGIIHRAGISETLLVFAEHRNMAPDLPLAALAQRLRRAAPERRLAIEAATVDEATQAIDAGFEVIQLEKFKPEAVQAVARHAAGCAPAALIAATGGVNAENVAAFISAGARLIVTSWPYSAKPRDFSTSLTRR